MLFSMFTIKDTVTRINNLEGQMKPNTKNEELSTYQNKFYAFAYDLALGLGEAYFTIASALFAVKYENIITEIERAQKAKTIEELRAAMKSIVSEFKDFEYDEYSVYNFHDKADEFRRDCHFRRQFELTNSRGLTEMVKNIKTQIDRDVTLFYPDCYDGNNIDSFGLTLPRLLSYGNEGKDEALTRAKRKMHKVVKGPLRGSRIQNNAFDIMYVQPQVLYDFDPNDVFANKRVERTYLGDMFKYLRNDGVMVVTMPYTRLFKDVCAMFSKQFKNIQVCKVSNQDFSDIGLIHIIGQRETSKEIRPEEYAKLRRLYDYNNVPTIDELDMSEYVLPRTSTIIELFKGSVLDLEEIEAIVDNTSIMDKIWASQKVEKLDENIKNPLLPFNIGQLGLVLTSGCLDGIVDEQDGFKHLIKGRVSKQILEVETDTDKGLEVTETTVNKVEINVLLPNGEFKVLA